MSSQSIWAQCELIVIANDPEPAEQAFLEAFAGANPQVDLHVVERETVYRSWNRAIALSSAPLLAIANVDDLRTTSSLEEQVRALEMESDALFSYGGFSTSRSFPPATEGRYLPPRPFDREEFTRGMFLGPFFVWRKTGNPATTWFDEQLRVAGDFDLAVRLALHGRGIPSSASLGVYFDDGGGLSTSGGTQAVERTAVILRYGIYDKLEPALVPAACRYVIPMLLLPDGTWTPVAELVSDYASWLMGRQDRWFRARRRQSAIVARALGRIVRKATARSRATEG